MSTELLPPLEGRRKTGNEPLHSNTAALGPVLLDFWQWSTSNLVDNTLRGTYAEWLVAVALDCAGGARSEWGSFDILTPDGVRIEVKSSAYIQSWAQNDYSTIQFSIRPAYAWDPATNSWADIQTRDSDLYVFCLLAEKDQSRIDPLDVNQWCFYVAPTALLDGKLGAQKVVGLSTLERLGLSPLPFEQLASAIRQVAATV